MSNLSISIPNTDEPYASPIRQFLSRQFPGSNPNNKGDLLENITAELIGSARVRNGHKPLPEALVTIRRVIRWAIENNKPIPILIPMGSRKPIPGFSVDIAEVGALRTLKRLRDCISFLHSPGLQINMRREDLIGLYLGGEEFRHSILQYGSDFDSLVKVLGLDFITVNPESKYLTERLFVDYSDEIAETMYEYLHLSWVLPDGDGRGLPSYKKLQELGWNGIIPKEQRLYYIDRYEKLYPHDGMTQHVQRMAKYFSASLVRYKHNASGASPEWNGHITLSFVGRIPGTPDYMENNRIYYRVFPSELTGNHMPFWRGKGFLKVNGSVKPQLGSFTDKELLSRLNPNTARFSQEESFVDVRADYLLEE